MIKKIIATITALTLAAAMLSSCGNTDNSDTQSGTDSTVSTSDSASGEASSDAGSSADSAASGTDDSTATITVPEPSLTIDGEKIDTKDIVMCTVDGNDISFDMFRYYYYYVMTNLGLDSETLASNEEAFAALKSSIIEQFKRDYTTVHLASENGITLTDESKKNIEEKLNTIKSNYDDEAAFQNALKMSYLTEEVYTKMLEIAELYTIVENQLLTNGGKYATSKEDFKKIVKDTSKYSRVIHILIPYWSQAEITDEETKSSYESMSLSEKTSAKRTAYQALSDEEKEKVKEASKKVAEEALKKAKDGEDFSKLITEYGWDPGMESQPGGYYINENSSFVKEFKEKSFELKENEISDLVENESYGWFIIKRLPVDMDYVEEKIDSMIIEYDTPAINQMFNDLVESLEFKESEYFTKLKPDSIT